jgi:hypothetical protein
MYVWLQGEAASKRHSASAAAGLPAAACTVLRRGPGRAASVRWHTAALPKEPGATASAPRALSLHRRRVRHRGVALAPKHCASADRVGLHAVAGSCDTHGGQGITSARRCRRARAAPACADRPRCSEGPLARGHHGGAENQKARQHMKQRQRPRHRERQRESCERAEAPAARRATSGRARRTATAPPAAAPPRLPPPRRLGDDCRLAAAAAAPPLLLLLVLLLPLAAPAAAAPPRRRRRGRRRVVVAGVGRRQAEAAGCVVLPQGPLQVCARDLRKAG